MNINKIRKLILKRKTIIYLVSLIGISFIFSIGIGGCNATAEKQNNRTSEQKMDLQPLISLEESGGTLTQSSISSSVQAAPSSTPSQVFTSIAQQTSTPVPLQTSNFSGRISSTSTPTQVSSPSLVQISKSDSTQTATLVFALDATQQPFFSVDESNTGTLLGMSDWATQFLPLVIQQAIPTRTPTPTRTFTPTRTPTSTQTLLVFSDEFNGTSLNSSKWETQYPWGGTLETNEEQQCYSPDSVSVKNGILSLTAIEQTVTCMGIYEQRSNLPYRSGMIASHSHFSFKYGFAEIRAKVPAGTGLWPAFWLLPEVELPNTIDWPPEIDALEILGNETTKVYMGNWSGTEFNPEHYAGDYSGPDFSEDFHLFGMRWSPDEIIWYVDGVERFRSTQGISSVPMYLIANLAVGGSWPGSPTADTEFPSTFQIDYIHVYNEAY